MFVIGSAPQLQTANYKPQCMHLLNNEAMQAICWTLIHSLWQGLLLAVIGGIIILVTKKSNSAIRYNLLSGLFLAFILTVFFTFERQYNLASVNNKISDSHVTAHSIQNIKSIVSSVDETPPEKNNIAIFIDYFNEHASLIVTIWFIVLSAQLINLIANAAYIQRIKHYKTYYPPIYWKRRVNELAEKLNVKQKIVLLQSGIVKVPVMVGFFKPVILFPLSLLSQLPPEQIEAVLLHELAHIKRKDYFVNMLQNLAEIIFFFNPGLLWISSLIKDERENCCDDIALRAINNKKEFIHALVSFQEFHLENSKYSLAFPGRKNHLLNRIKRIITSNNKTLNNMEKISLASCIIIIGLIVFAFKPTDEKNTFQKQTASNVSPIVHLKDTVPGTQESRSLFSYSTKLDGKEYRIKEVNDKVTEFLVDGKKIPDDKIKDYQDIIDRIHIQAKKEQEELQLQNEALQKERNEMMEQREIMAKKQQEMDELENRDRATEYARKAEKLEMMNKLLAEQEALNLKLDQLKRMQEMDALAESKSIYGKPELLNDQQSALIAQNEDMKKALADIAYKSRIIRDKGATDADSRKLMYDLQDHAKELYEQQEILNKEMRNKMLMDARLHDNNSLPFRRDDVLMEVPRAPFANGVIERIVENMLDAKLITSVDDLSFTLNKKEFKINGVVQPEEIHQRFKESYIKGNSNNHIKYSKHGGSTSTEAIIND